MNSRNTKIFLSYHHGDGNKFAERFVNRLEQNKNISVWVASTQLSNGTEIFDSISKAIHECDYFINIAGFSKSKWQDIEMQFALAEQLRIQNIKIITIVLDDTPNKGTLLGQGALGVVINFPKDFESGFAEVLKYISLNSSDSLASFSIGTLDNNKTIIDISSGVNEKLITFFSNNPEQLKTMDRRLFEEFIAELFYGFGFKVELTQQTRDGGRDIIAIKKAETNLKYLIECKRPDPGNVVGIKPVRELFGVKQDEKATKAILATTSYFSNDAKLFFERNKWELEPKDFDGIMQWIETYKQQNQIIK